MMELPDPILTANIYCSGRLDEVIQRAVAPFWRRLAELQPDHRSSLWMVRYSKCGEHLKLRLHGPESQRQLLRRLLTEAVEAYFCTLGPPEEGAHRPSRQDAPAIDLEDEEVSDYPDRSLLWTRYQRSHVSLDGKSFLGHDRYVALITACLAKGCEMVIAAFQPDERGQLSYQSRQSTLLKALVEGLAVSDFPQHQRAPYLAYHRDWLLRFAVADDEKEAKLLAYFDLQISRMARGKEQLRRAVAERWAGPATEMGVIDSEWQRALATFLQYLAAFRGQPACQGDPFSRDVVFPPVFKVFHGLANQLGLSMLEEGFAHHLLLRSLADGEKGDTVV